MKKGFLTTTLLLMFTLMPGVELLAQESDAEGQVYVVKDGDGIYKLARQFFGTLRGVSWIVNAHNEKAAIDDRFEVIDRNKQLEIGQLLWIPNREESIKAVSKPQTPSQTVKVPEAKKPDTKPQVKPQTKPQVITPKPTQNKADTVAKNVDATVNNQIERARAAEDAGVMPGTDQAIIVKVPKSNCDIRVWYNYQVVAIARLNERWKANGETLLERAKKAYNIRHMARVNGRFMMADRFEVATLRDRDNKKYGNPDGPTFDYLVNYHRESGFEGDEIYQRIIESSARTSPVFNSECKR